MQLAPRPVRHLCCCLQLAGGVALGLFCSPRAANAQGPAQPPVVLREVSPQAPADAVLDEAAEVVLAVTIDETGKVVEEEVVRSASPPEWFAITDG